jgi:nucleoside-diphosphate-sugar epimerase
MPALVTGASGFLGSHLVERLLAHKQEVRAMVRDRSRGQALRAMGAQVVVGDVTDPESLERAVTGCPTVYHLAAHVSDWGPWARFDAVTVRGTENLLRALRSASLDRFVLVSSAAVYDDRHARRLRTVTEDAPLGSGDRAYGHYAKAKVRAEEAAWQASRDTGLPLTVLRPTWIYGPRDHTILPRLLEHFDGPTACWVGRRDPSVDPIYVTDVADAAILAAGHSQSIGQAYNIAPDAEVGLRRFLLALFRELDIRPPTLTVPYAAAAAATWACETWARLLRQQDPPVMTRAGLACVTVDQHADPGKAVRQLGWRPRVSLEDGARETARWLRSTRVGPD